MITTVTPNVALDKHYLIPGFSLRGTHRIQHELTLPSGKGLNVARVLARYGVPNIATGVVAGFIGRQICHLLDGFGLEHNFVWASGESRLCLTIMDPTSDTHTEILENGPAYTLELVAELEAIVRRLAKGSDYVAVSGNPPPGTEVDVLKRLVRVAKAAGARVLLDARSDWLRAGVEALPNIIKPNWQEFEDLTGPCPNQEAAVARSRQLIAGGVELVLITMGAAGALAVTNAGAWQVTPPQIPAVSPVGCGDAMAGGLLTALSQAKPLVESLLFATAVATSNACHHGAGVFDTDQVEELLHQVTIQRL